MGTTSAYLAQAYQGIAAMKDVQLLGQLTAIAGGLALQRSESREMGEALAGTARSLSLDQLQAAWQGIVQADEPTLRLFSPIVVARGVEGVSPTKVLLSDPPAGFNWINDETLTRATDGKGLRAKVRIANAVRLQAEVWGRMQVLKALGQRVKKEEGVLLTSRGDWEVLFSLLLQQAGVIGKGNPLFAGFLTRGDEADALLMTAGFHPRFGDITASDRRLRATSPLVMFPPDAREDLLRGFELLLWNPTGDTMDGLTPADFGGMGGEAVVAGATKAVGSTGEARGLLITDRIRVLQQAIGEGRIKFAFGGGFTGADAIVRRGDLPYQEGIKAQGLHLVLGVDDWETGIFWGQFLTGTTEWQEIEEGGRRFQNVLLGVPMIVDVVGDPILRDAQTAASVWKNVGSIILGRGLFNLIYEKIEKKAFDRDADLVNFLEGEYQCMMGEMIRVIRQTLVDVEGFKENEAVILSGVLKDLYSSWGVKEMGTLVATVKDVFFSKKDGPILRTAVEGAKKRIGKAFSTRNTLGGFGIGMGVRLLLFGKINSIWNAVPERQYEGRTSLKLIGARLEFLARKRGMTVDTLRSLLHDSIAAMAETVLENVTPNMLPNATRRILGDFTAGLGRISYGTPISRNLAAALLGKPTPDVAAEDINHLQRIRQIAHLDDLRGIVGVLAKHIHRAIALIHDLGEHQAEGARDFTDHLRGMARTLEFVNAKILAPDQTASLDSKKIMSVLAAIKLMVDQVDLLNHGYDIERVTQATSLHLIQIVRFIRGEIQSLTILAGDPPVEVPQEYRRFLPA